MSIKECQIRTRRANKTLLRGPFCIKINYLYFFNYNFLSPVYVRTNYNSVYIFIETPIPFPFLAETAICFLILFICYITFLVEMLQSQMSGFGFYII